MSKPIIEIEGIGKRYRIGAKKGGYLSLRDELAKWFSPAARHARAAAEEFWALKDVSFSVEPGEAVGIIGRNGAGKSTLLKILSQITPPTEGKITMRGRVGSLLEVGTGFHPELTGRENIYMNGAILGMRRQEITRKFDEIVAFAELAKFLDTPVKRYSSGMYVRLAFAVAAHLEPEILVVDEVLAVGDAEFQRRCLGKMGEVTHSGRTVLFVSHSMPAIASLCSSCVTLHDGRVRAIGATQQVIEAYLSGDASMHHADLTVHPNRTPSSRGTLKWVEIEGLHLPSLIPGKSARITVGFARQELGAFPEVAFTIETVLRQRVFSFATYWAKRTLEMSFTSGEATCVIDKLPLSPGTYTISVAVGTVNNPFQDHIPNALQFDVESTDYYGTGKIPTPNHGAILIDASWHGRFVSAEQEHVPGLGSHGHA